MNISRNILLWFSRNEFLKRNIPNKKFVQKALKRFMPGETIDDAIAAAKLLTKSQISSTFTYLGENISTLDGAQNVVDQYLFALQKINDEKLDIEISLKLTQIGLDISAEKALMNFNTIAGAARKFKNNVWIDMEDSSYVDRTLNLYIESKKNFNNIGVCLQAYLYRTAEDVLGLKTIKPWIRLVKGAYLEKKDVAYQLKKEVDRNYFNIAQLMLENLRADDVRMVFATHDVTLLNEILSMGAQIGVPADLIEFQMLYGIKTADQIKFAHSKFKTRVLISYGKNWYPWYVRRLAERPANIWFIIKNLFK